MNFSSFLEKLLNHISLSEEESSEIMGEILKGSLTPSQCAAFLAALRSKGETIGEIVGFVKALRNNMIKVSCSSAVIVDTCGTGGDRTGSFNISTASSFVVAGAGFTVAKHGNRSVSSHCGSADVLESLGVNIAMSKETAQRCLNSIGITFLFAPLYHPAMKNIAPVRKEMGVRTIFNILGPLLNPAESNVQVIGVSQLGLIPVLSQVLKQLSRKNSCSLVLHDSGYDEWLLTKKAKGALVQGLSIRPLTLSEQGKIFKKVNPMEVTGSDAVKNARMIEEILSGRESAAKTVTVANAALAIFCAKKAEGNSLSLKEAALLAEESIKSGTAYNKLKLLKELSHQ